VRHWIRTQLITQQPKSQLTVTVMSLNDFPVIRKRTHNDNLLHGYWRQQLLKLRAAHCYGSPRLVITDSKTWPVRSWHPHTLPRYLLDDAKTSVFWHNAERMRIKLGVDTAWHTHWPSVLPPVIWHRTWVEHMLKEWRSFDEFLDWAIHHDQFPDYTGQCTTMMSEFMLVEAHRQLTNTHTTDQHSENPNFCFPQKHVDLLNKWAEGSHSQKELRQDLHSHPAWNSQRFVTIKWHDPTHGGNLFLNDHMRNRVADMLLCCND